MSVQVTSKTEALKDQAKWQLYRIRFSQTEKEREEIFVKLENCNKRLRKLLQISEDNVDMTQKRLAAQTVETTALCRFWRQASRVFKALSVVWNCNCQPQHCAKLLLEHRASTSTDFHFLYAKGAGSGETARRIKITERNTDVDAAGTRTSRPKAEIGNMSTHNPTHRDSAPRRSAMKTNTATRAGETRYKSLLNLDPVVIGPILTCMQGTAGGGYHHSAKESTGVHSCFNLSY